MKDHPPMLGMTGRYKVIYFVFGIVSGLLLTGWQTLIAVQQNDFVQASSDQSRRINELINLPLIRQFIHPEITIKAVGDMIPGTDFPDNRLHPNPPELFRAVRPVLQGADILFGNFESTLTQYPYTPKDVSGGMTFAFRTPPAYINLLRDVGFNVLSVANNHSFDFDTQGFIDTVRTIEAAGILSVGQKGKIVYQNVKGITIAYIGFSHLSEHNNLNDLKAGIALVVAAKQQAEIVIISVHAGAEGTDATRIADETEYFFGENRGNLFRFARSMVDAGADLVLGHGPHVPRAIELYKDRLIVYSLGNFMGYRTLSTVAELSYSFVLEVKLDREGNFRTGRVIPLLLNDVGIPSPDPQAHSIKLIRELMQLDFPQGKLVINDRGVLQRR